MKFSESWLRTLVNPDLDTEALSHRLTMAGLEVEECDPAAPTFDRVIVARVLSVEKHPDADRLNVCQVDLGTGQPVQIVCGAPNVAPGLVVPCALPGATLPGGLAIKIAKVRGIESSGMLCSARELGISDDAEGLMVLPVGCTTGQSVRDTLDLDDHLLTLKLTPNRADCLSLSGIAREVGALTGAAVELPKVAEVPPSVDGQRAIILDAPEACPRYCGRVIAGVDARAPTPEWMRQRLERSGLRAISALVDITNYVMLELGQPLHAFDNTKLSGAIHVRMAKPGEQLLLLNEQTITIDTDVLMIADEEKPLAMAGIMGGEDSGITLATTDLFLESAFFTPAAIAGRARRYGFTSDASHRFERGVDFAGARTAIERATQLVIDICGGDAGPVTETSAEWPARPPVRLRTTRVRRVLGLEIDRQEIARYFDRLGLIAAAEGDDFIVTPPSYRFDIEIEEDLIEEIARLYGYDHIPAPIPTGQLPMLPMAEDRRPVARLKQLTAAAGYQEVVTYSFVDADWERDFAGNADPIRLANPIASQMGVMRTTLIGGLVATVSHNLRRKQARIRIFEVGRCFDHGTDADPVAGFRQTQRIGLAAYGPAQPEQWGNSTRPVDFFDVKGDVESLLAPTALRFEPTTHPALHPGRCATIVRNGLRVGVIGELHPRWQQAYDLPQSLILAELDIEPLTGIPVPAYAEVSKLPPVVRDIAIVVDHALAAQSLLDAARAAADPVVREIELFDLYAGKGVEPGRKSLALRIVMQDTQRTLKDAEVDEVVAKILARLEADFAATLRI